MINPAGRFAQSKRSRITAGALFIVTMVIIVVSLFMHDSKKPAVHASTEVKVTAPHLVKQPVKAKQIAHQLRCHRFIDKGEHLQVGVVSSGVCHKHGHKFAIDTFVSHRAMINWLSMAESYGVVPRWETSTSVTYKSVNK